MLQSVDRQIEYRAKVSSEQYNAKRRQERADAILESSEFEFDIDEDVFQQLIRFADLLMTSDSDAATASRARFDHEHGEGAYVVVCDTTRSRHRREGWRLCCMPYAHSSKRRARMFASHTCAMR